MRTGRGPARGGGGAAQNIKIARDAICALIMGSPPGKVYSRLRTITARLAEKF